MTRPHLVLNDARPSTNELEHGIVGREGEQGGMASKDAPHVVAHVGEVQVLLGDSKLGLKGGNLLAQDQQLLDQEELAVQSPCLLADDFARSLQTAPQISI